MEIYTNSMSPSLRNPWISLSANLTTSPALKIISLSLARSNLPVVFCIDRAGIISGDGDTHQGIFDVAFLSTIPNIEILAPKNIDEAKLAIDYSLNQNHPIAIRYSKYDYNNLFLPDKDFKTWDVIKEGKNAIVSYGDLLNRLYPYVKDPDLALVNAKNLSLVDLNILNKYQKIIVIEDVIKTSCLGEKLISYVYHNHLNNIILTHNLGMTYLETGNKDELIKKYIGDLEEIIRKESKC